jgi:hypothetical protein
MPFVGEQRGSDPVLTAVRKVGASLATVAAAAGLIVFAHAGAFDDRNDPFPHAVLAPPR